MAKVTVTLPTPTYPQMPPRAAVAHDSGHVLEVYDSTGKQVAAYAPNPNAGGFPGLSINDRGGSHCVSACSRPEGTDVTSAHQSGPLSFQSSTSPAS